MAKDSSHGRFCWFDLMTTDLEGGMHFYTSIIPWSTEQWEGSEVLNGPMEVPGGNRIAQCQDPQGAVFALHASTG